MSGIFIAYFGLGAMALIPIYFGSKGSLRFSDEKNAESEHLSKEDAYWFPVIGSCVLFGLYLLFTLFSKEYINLLLTVYFAGMGVLALTRTLYKIVNALILTSPELRPIPYKLTIEKSEKVLHFLEIDYTILACFAISSLFTGYYIYSKNWIASNIFGEAFSTSAISLLNLDSFATGMILLSGLFFYDIFWVFGTDVMVTVAKSFDAPIKLLFPKDFSLFATKDFAMLGLGDIVIPGIFVALCLRFDQSIAANSSNKFPTVFSKPYFTTCFIAYVIGLVTTVFVMHTFKAAQPALLYLSPACILSVLGLAAVRGEIGTLFAFQSQPSEEETKNEKKKD